MNIDADKPSKQFHARQIEALNDIKNRISSALINYCLDSHFIFKPVDEQLLCRIKSMVGKLSPEDYSQ